MSAWTPWILLCTLLCVWMKVIPSMSAWTLRILPVYSLVCFANLLVVI